MRPRNPPSTCAECGILFRSERRHARTFCSLRCYHSHRRNENPRRRIVAFCPFCKKQLNFRFSKSSKIPKRKFCTTRCFYEWQKKRSAEGECVVCLRKAGDTKAKTKRYLTRGMCRNCYDKAQQLGFDPGLMELKRLTESLLKEVNRVSET